MNIQKETTIGEIVARNFRTAQVFESHGLDFCCGGKKTISEACTSKGIDADELIGELSSLSETGNQADYRFYNLGADRLAEYIVSTHHTYLIRALPGILAHALKVAEVHGNNHPETIKLARVFKDIKEELEVHMQKEEKMLFPHIKKICESERSGCKIDHPPFGTVLNPIKVMEIEHENAGRLTEELNTLTSGYTPPADACTTYKVLFDELKEFENDLHIHIHLENNVLFPKAIELEKKLTNQYSQ